MDMALNTLHNSAPDPTALGIERRGDVKTWPVVGQRAETT